MGKILWFGLVFAFPMWAAHFEAPIKLQRQVSRSVKRPLARMDTSCHPDGAGKLVTLSGVLKRGTLGVSPFVLLAQNGLEYDLSGTRFHTSAGPLGEGAALKIEGTVYRAPMSDGRCRFFIDTNSPAKISDAQGGTVNQSAIPSTEWANSGFTLFNIDDSRHRSQIPGIRAYLKILAFRAGALHADYTQDRLSEGKYRGTFQPSVRLPPGVTEQQFCAQLRNVDALGIVRACGLKEVK